MISTTVLSAGAVGSVARILLPVVEAKSLVLAASVLDDVSLSDKSDPP